MSAVKAEDFSPLEVRLAARAAVGGAPLIADGVEVPTTHLLAAARAVAARLLTDGVEKGDYVALRMRNSSEYLACAFGTMFAGAILIPVNARLTTSELAGLYGSCLPRAWIGDSEGAEVLSAAEGRHGVDVRYVVDADPGRPLREFMEWSRPGHDGPVVPIAPEDIGAVFFTAGTTGAPKGALTSHAAIDAFIDVTRSTMGMTERDRVILPMPMFYSGGLKASIANILIGARLVCFRSWKAPDLVAAMGEHKGTFLWAVPSVWALMLKSPGFKPSMVRNTRILWRGGSHTPAAILEALKELFPRIPHYHSYGQTECNLASLEPEGWEYPDSVGFATRGGSISIEGHRVPETEGEIWLSGPQQFSGYLDSEDWGDRASLQDGWVRSGDRGWLDRSGRLYIIGRGSEIIIRGGENISTAEVERVLIALPGVEEAAVVPVPDDLFGQELRAVVVPTNGAALDPEEIRKACGALLAEFKVPKFVEIHQGQLPRTPAGKIARREL